MKALCSRANRGVSITGSGKDKKQKSAYTPSSYIIPQATRFFLLLQYALLMSSILVQRVFTLADNG